MPARSHLVPLALPIELRTLLRGLGQVLLQPHAGTGAGVLAGLLLADPALGCAALAGTAAANIAALLTGGAKRGSSVLGSGSRQAGMADANASTRSTGTGPLGIDAATNAAGGNARQSGPANAVPTKTAAARPTHATPRAADGAGGGARQTDLADMALGLHGYSGALAALAAVALIPDRSQAFAIALIAAMLAGALYRPIAHGLARRGGGAYSLPAVIATACWLPWFMPLAVSHAGAWPGAPAVLSGAALAAFAQAAFASGTLPGLFLLAGLALASPRAAGLGLLGALLGSALLLAAGGADTRSASACAAGLLGYNGALAAIALAARGPRIALAGALGASLLHLLALRLGLPPFSAPFAIAANLLRIASRESVAPSSPAAPAAPRAPAPPLTTATHHELRPPR
ncbi:urea transporter [Burkholderia gladioli]|uniref:urea transporter n=3 Tax=Burkholderia gladioli TaxID=28095 RepID=UPI00164015B0|nr:urea transporter [Burkholderia gladioli]